ncbi:methylated-DNA--[protein]-cysteine S-methyltransferase [Neptunicella sp. SCSIO 80796]|uniref:methylated-DNA--[protein]-cysteine S-methyltransferase n=1 Tax=Neptunicella plasticusilytica TaxID=3117012 RepID=UPI003A4DFCFA
MKQSTSTKQRLFDLAKYIEQHSDQMLNLDTLAQQAAISPYHLQRQFSQYFGVSPKQFQNAIRIQKLKQALRQGEDVTSAIYQAGFGSSSRLYEQIDGQLGMTPATYRNGGKHENISFAMCTTQLGPIIMAATSRGVCFVSFADSYTELLNSLHEEYPLASLTPTPPDTQQQLDHWISALELYIGQKTNLPQIPLDLSGTAFQISVWRFLTNLKPGQTMSYKQIATGIESPNSHRAVANACGANKIAILIPCHRVIRGDGSPGGYRWGDKRKQQLLGMEADN